GTSRSDQTTDKGHGAVRLAILRCEGRLIAEQVRCTAGILGMDLRQEGVGCPLKRKAAPGHPNQLARLGTGRLNGCQARFESISYFFIELDLRRQLHQSLVPGMLRAERAGYAAERNRPVRGQEALNVAD